MLLGGSTPKAHLAACCPALLLHVPKRRLPVAPRGLAIECMAFSQQPSGQEDGPHFTGWPLVEASGGVGAQELCPLSSLTDHCCALLSLPQCEEIKTTVQRHTQSPMYSKEDLNRLNQAIQRLTVDVDGTKDQVR